MTNRYLISAIFTALFLMIGQTLSLAAECAACDRDLNSCRSPLHARYVSCMNGNKGSCGTKCSNDCKNDQKCISTCVQSCEGAGNTCQGTFKTASTQCMNTYQACKKNCTR